MSELEATQKGMAQGKEVTSVRVMTLSARDETGSRSSIAICVAAIYCQQTMWCDTGTWWHPVAKNASDPNAALDL